MERATNPLKPVTVKIILLNSRQKSSTVLRLDQWQMCVWMVLAYSTK